MLGPHGELPLRKTSHRLKELHCQLCHLALLHALNAGLEHNVRECLQLQQLYELQGFYCQLALSACTDTTVKKKNALGWSLSIRVASKRSEAHFAIQPPSDALVKAVKKLTLAGDHAQSIPQEYVSSPIERRCTASLPRAAWTILVG